MSRAFSNELKDQIINEYRKGRSVRELAADYEPHESTIRHWVKSNEVTPSGSSESTEEILKRLRSENRRLQQDNAILEKAATWFASQSDARTSHEVQVYRFMQVHHASVTFTIKSMCRIFQIKRENYYRWRKHRRVEDHSEQSKATTEAMLEVVVDLAIESWRFVRTFERLLMKLDFSEQNRYSSRYNWFKKKIKETLEQVDLNLVNIEEGSAFDPGLAVTPLNIDEFHSDDILVIDQMLEPIIMGKDSLVKTGTVTLRKVEL